MTLREALRAAGLSYAAAARELGVSKPAVVNMVAHGRWPRAREGDLRAALDALLAERGIDLTGASGSREAPQEEVAMKVQLSRAAREQFGLGRDPWEVRRAEDVWLGRRWRYAAQALEDAAQTGGLLALVGESGTGKSTLRRYVQDRLRREAQPVRVIEPLTVDRSRLTAAAICDAILDDVAPGERPRARLEYRTRQVRRVLTESARAGNAHVLVIEEAHDLHLSTVKYLKRFWEMEDGFQRLLGIVLLAQPELLTVLDEQSWAAREVVRRIEIVELGALDGPGELQEFLGQRLGAKVFAAEACAALQERLARRTGRGVASMAWPLAVTTWATRALNLAAEMRQPQVAASTIAAL